MRHGADAAPAPPRGLRVGRDADRAGHVRGPAVAGLHEPVVVASREVEDRFAAGRAHHRGDVAHDQRPPRQRAEIDGLQVREQAVVALDRHHRLPRQRSRRPRKGRAPRADPSPRPSRRRASLKPAPSLSIAIASSIPPSSDSCFWKTCMQHARVMALHPRAAAWCRRSTRPSNSPRAAARPAGGRPQDQGGRWSALRGSLLRRVARRSAEQLAGEVRVELAA